jgi:hypothetical protein
VLGLELGANLIERHRLSARQLVAAPAHACRELRIREDRERLLQALQVVRAYQDRRRTAVTRDGHAIVLASDTLDELGELGLDGGQRKGVGHDQDRSPFAVSPHKAA